MARRSTLEEIVVLASEVPWWLSAGIGGIGFYLLKFYIPTHVNAPNLNVYAPILSVVAYAILGACLLGAVIRMFRQFRDRWLFKKQSSIDSIRALDWNDFERLVGEAYRREGYYVEPTRSGSDGGVDVVLTKDGRTTLVQCKHWKSSKVGVKPVRELAGVVAARRADGGIFVCSGQYTNDARNFAEQSNIALVDSEALVRLMKLDSTAESTESIGPAEHSGSCPQCGSALVRRVARRGSNAGSEFLGCDAFPKCRFTRDLS